MRKDKSSVKRGISAVFGQSTSDQVSSESELVAEPAISGQQTVKSPINPPENNIYPGKMSGRPPRGKIKVTYYLSSDCVKSLKHLSVELDSDYSSLVEEAIRDIIRKYARLPDSKTI